MNKLAKGFLLAIGATVIIAAAAVLCVNLYMESDAVRTHAEEALTQDMGVPVKISRIHFSPFGALRVVGVVIPQPDKAKVVPNKEGISTSAASANFLEAGEISGVICWPSLFGKGLLINRLIISDASVVWRQDGNGQFVLPFAETNPQPSENKSVANKENQSASTAPPSSMVEFRIETAQLKNSSFLFQDRKGKRIAAFEQVNVDCKNLTQAQVEGRASIKTVRLHESIELTHFSTPFTFKGEVLELSKIAATLCEGQLEGSFKLAPLSDEAPFTVNLAFKQIDLEQILSATGMDTSTQKITGSILGNLQMKGNLEDKRSFEGFGDIAVQEGGIKHFLLFEALQVDALSQLDLQQATVAFRIANAKVYVDNLILQTPNVRLNGTGTMDFNGKLDIDSGLAVNQKVRRQLPNWMSNSFQPISGTDESEIKFRVEGTVQRPSTDLVKLLLGQKLSKQVMDVYDFLKGGRRKEKSNKAESKPSLPSTSEIGDAILNSVEPKAP